MNIFSNNILNLSFLFGFLFSFIRAGYVLPVKIHRFLTLSILLLVGFKGGGPLVEHFSDEAPLLLALLVLWGLIHPFLSFYLLKISTRIDSSTAAAVAASFGSISVMTFAAGASFLESADIGFQKLLIGIMAILEVPAIVSGLFLAKRSGEVSSLDWKKMILEAFFNKSVLTIFLGLLLGALFHFFRFDSLAEPIVGCFKPLLCLFLLDMGLHVGRHRAQFKLFSWPLTLFGVYMPLIGASVGLLISYLLNLDVGTGTLIAVLTASASYIAVPAAMRAALPQARESIYLPLALGVAFPFNVFIGIPIYYRIASEILF